MNTEEFINKANLIHNNKYDYSLVNYKNNITKIKIICPEHGIFEQQPNNHLIGRGCPICGLGKGKNKPKFNLEKWLENARKIFPDYDYSLVSYKSTKIPIKIVCKEHGVFLRRASDLLVGIGCPECGGTKKLSNKEFIEKAVKIHGNRYDYSKLNYINGRSKIEIICPLHGSFFQRAKSHLYGSGCPKCHKSHGEKNIELFFKENKIEYEIQKKFKNCKDKRLLPYDFYLPNYNLLIEFHGLQHKIWSKYFHPNYHDWLLLKHHDWLKRKYACTNKIDLLVCWYNEDYIEKIKERIKK